MTRPISPLLLQKLQQQNNQKPKSTVNHAAVYDHLLSHANDVKPNKAKAKLIKENPIQAAVSSIKDFKDDCKNFKNAVAFGQSNDNKLGRLNDVGLKLGAALIATFLALNSKTKTESIMRFVGGGAFLAAMKVWPKLFINLPARMIHGFDIDQRYISAQGDKKDFFLDNQFLPWDAYSDEELREIGKRTGINFDSKNGKEKIQRKMQKTALQNRTLWMATAGFATPLMTALFCDGVEPMIENAIVNKGIKNAKIAAQDLSETLYKSGKSVADSLTKEFENILKNYKAKDIDEEFFKQIADNFNLNNMTKGLVSSDELKSLEGYNPAHVIKALKSLQDTKSTFEINETFDSIISSLKKLKELDASALLGGKAKGAMALTSNEIALAIDPNLFENLKNILKEKGVAEATIEETIGALRGSSLVNLQKILTEKNIGTEIISSTIENLSQTSGQNFTLENLRNTLLSKGIQSDAADRAIEELRSKGKFQNGEFLKELRKYNSEVILPTRTRLKAYLKQLNSAIGSVAESGYTREFKSTVKNFFDKYTNNSPTRTIRNTARSIKSSVANRLALVKKFYQEGKDSEIENFKAIFARQKDEFRPKLSERLKNFYEGIKTDFDLPSKRAMLKQFKDGTVDDSAKILSDFFAQIPANERDYKEAIANIFGAPMNQELETIVNRLTSRENLEKLVQVSKDAPLATSKEIQNMNQAIFGRNSDIIPDIITNFRLAKKADLETIKARLLICANFERRIKEGGDLFALAQDKTWLEQARDLVYKGSISLRENTLGTGNEVAAKKLISQIFQANEFTIEEGFFGSIKQVVNDLLNYNKFNDGEAEIIGKSLRIASKKNSNNPQLAFFKTNNLAELIKEQATNLYNNKTWKKTFIPLSIGLVAITLLIQPFFGNIKKDYPQQKGGSN